MTSIVNGRSSHPPNGKNSSHPPHPPVGRSSAPPNRASSSPPTRISSNPPGARKRKRLRKEEIVAEATRLFAERGYEGASMGDLAERVGLRKASLFHHFPSKDVLYATVLKQLMESVRVAISAAVTMEGTFADRLDALSDALTDVLGAQPYAARLLVREAMDWGPVMKEGLGKTINDVLGAAHTFATAGQAAGEFDPDVDMPQVIVSLIGIHFMPFAIAELVEGFTGTSPFRPAFIADRKTAVRAHMRNVVLAGAKK